MRYVVGQVVMVPGSTIREVPGARYPLFGAVTLERGAWVYVRALNGLAADLVFSYRPSQLSPVVFGPAMLPWCDICDQFMAPGSASVCSACIRDAVAIDIDVAPWFLEAVSARGLVAACEDFSGCNYADLFA